MTHGKPAAENETAAGRRASPALTAGLLLMPALIAAGLLRERLDAPTGPDLRPTLSDLAIPSAGEPARDVVTRS